MIGLNGASIGKWGQIYRTQHHTASLAMTRAHCKKCHTNLGASGTITFTLPQDADVDDVVDFVVMAAQQLRIDPGAAGGIYVSGAKQTDNKYIWADGIGESVRLIPDGNGDWVALFETGIWGVES